MASNIPQLLKVALLVPMDNPSHDTCRWGAPVFLWGPPSTVKSAFCEQASERAVLPIETIYLSTHQPEDISGVPMSEGKDNVTMVCPIPQVQELIGQKKGVLFLDELSWARPAVQAASLGVVYNRRFAGRRLPGRVRILAAGNAPEDGGGGWALTPPQANRFMHFEVKPPSVDAWTEWLLHGDNTVHETAEQNEARIVEGWSMAWSRVRGQAAGFLRSNNDKLYKLPPVGHKDRSRAWASPRSWEMLLRTLATCDILGEDVLGIEFIEACVGSGIATEWLEWVSKANLPNPVDMLNNGWKPDRRRIDVAFAAYSSAIAYVLSKPKPEQRPWAIKAWKLLSVPILKENLADVALAPMKALMNGGWTTKQGPDVEAVARDCIARLGSSGLSAYAQSKA